MLSIIIFTILLINGESKVVRDSGNTSSESKMEDSLKQVPHCKCNIYLSKCLNIIYNSNEFSKLLQILVGHIFYQVSSLGKACHWLFVFQYWSQYQMVQNLKSKQPRMTQHLNQCASNVFSTLKKYVHRSLENKCDNFF